jgi:AraC family transcriptional regulator
LSEAVLQKIDNYINDPLTATVNLNDLAALAGLSRCHFIRAFKATTTLTPMAYVERSRIERARLLVTDGQMRLAEIAHFIGFADQSHFTRRFKAHVGCTPGDYARLRSADIVRV